MGYQQKNSATYMSTQLNKREREIKKNLYVEMLLEAVKRLQNFYTGGCLHEAFHLWVSLPRGRKLHASNSKLLQSC